MIGDPFMKAADLITTIRFYPKQNPQLRLFALWYFTILITLWTILGHIVLGFEQAWIHPVAGVLTACSMQTLLEWADARGSGRDFRYAGGVKQFLSFLTPALIPGFACAMLIYPNERIMPIVFAAALSIASKVIFRAPVGGGATQHIFNPSNIGITITLVAFPFVGLAPPYHFTENVTGIWDWVIPGIILVSGIIIHALFTGRLPMVIAWLLGFAAQGLTRAAIFGIPWIVPFIPMTSAAFILFTLYMIPDPATTPIKPWRQIVFGVAVAAVYGMLLVFHVVFGLFFALALVCALRGILLYIASWQREPECPPQRAVVAGAAS
jgi:enediyne biosynthesis protein E5